MRSQKIIVTLIGAVSFCALAHPGLEPAWGQETIRPSPSMSRINGKGEKSCNVVVEVLEGYTATDDRMQENYHLSSYSGQASQQLRQLPYRKFRQVERFSERVAFDEKHNFLIHDGVGTVHRLTVSPLAVENGRVRLYVDWVGPKGEGYLSTKMRVVHGKSVVLGTEGSSEKTGIVLALQITCEETQGNNSTR